MHNQSDVTFQSKINKTVNNYIEGDEKSKKKKVYMYDYKSHSLAGAGEIKKYNPTPSDALTGNARATAYYYNMNKVTNGE